MFFSHTDHLNTPRLVADATGTTVWRWDQAEPFGNNPADENPSGIGAFDLPLRLPGQYFDKETNLHYNYYRDYDPSQGIYKQSDPIGLRAGLNTYSYVAGSPLRYVDPEGLWCRDFLAITNQRYFATNKAIPGLIVPVGTGFVTTGIVARAVGGMTFLQATAYLGTYEAAAAFTSAAATTAIAIAAVGTAFQGGLYLGSALYTLAVDCEPLPVPPLVKVASACQAN